MPYCERWLAYVGKAKNGVWERWGSGNNHLTCANGVLNYLHENPSEVYDGAEAIETALAMTSICNPGEKFFSKMFVFVIKQVHILLVFTPAM